MNRDQITDKHRSRMAVVYVRQSSRHQVVHHRESQRRQRDLVGRATELGWSADQIQVVDDDQGVTASRSGSRFGFEEMVAMAALGKIGIILALEVARLARGNHDWYGSFGKKCHRNPTRERGRTARKTLYRQALAYASGYDALLPMWLFFRTSHTICWMSAGSRAR